MAEGTVFRRGDKPVEASVVLKLANGERPANDVVQGIAHLVASSVDGLESEHVTIVDDAGRMLTLDGEAGSLAGLTSRQLAVQREVESYLERKAQEIVGQIVGGANARVQVSALVNFDRVERTVQAVDPDKQASPPSSAPRSRRARRVAPRRATSPRATRRPRAPRPSAAPSAT
jgi:flagellar M-ring protein FliF